MSAGVLSSRSQHGFTLIELLVAMIIGLVASMALIRFLTFQTDSIRTENARRAAQMTTRNAMNFMIRQLEHIGRDPNGGLFSAAVPAIQEADVNNLHYLTNLSADITNNDTVEAWEDVTFAYADSVVWVTQGGGAAVALTDSATQTSYVPANGLIFTYFDSTGVEVASPVAAAANRARIRRINVSLTVRGTATDGTEPEVTLSQDVFLRNVAS
jgi:prepilin-type N-terminal cleavage/methylation domain-containing protein